MKTTVKIIRAAQFMAKDMSQARLEMRTNGLKWSVIRYLPAGMDIGPEQWTWRTQSDADTHWDSMMEWLTAKGFNSVSGFHGQHCEKVEHKGTGYEHADDMDGPYFIDGVRYCGRCHRYF